jgi:Fic family protein
MLITAKYAEINPYICRNLTRMYIYQQYGWPNFSWEQRSDEIQQLLLSVRFAQGNLLGQMAQLGLLKRTEAFWETLITDALKTSEIEGEFLQRSEVRSSVAKQLKLPTAGLVPSNRHTDGLVQMLLDATQNNLKPLTEERLFDWHAGLFPTGRSGIYPITVGGYRTDSKGPIQVISGGMGHEKIHFQAPEASQLPNEMRTFLSWINDTSTEIDLVLKASIAHFWFITLHAFDDGNGRMARAVTDYLLAQSESSNQRFYSMSAHILLKKKSYYQVLEASQRGELDISDWLVWFLECLNTAIAGSEKMLESVLEKAKFWRTYQDQTINERQRAMLNHLFDGFEGNLTTKKWAIIQKCSTDTALRDITELVEKNMLKKSESNGRSTHYLLP